MNFEHLRPTRPLVLEAPTPASNRKREHRKERRNRSQDKKGLKKIALLAADPHCATCGCQLVLKPDQRNTAHMFLKSLYCLKHVLEFHQDGMGKKIVRRDVSPVTVNALLEKQNGCCKFCHVTLSLEDGKPNSVQIDGHHLICLRHTPNHRRIAAMKRPAISEHRSLAMSGSTETWYVDGEQFETLELAESRAIELANLWGSKIEIMSGLPDQRLRKCVEVVYPQLVSTGC